MDRKLPTLVRRKAVDVSENRRVTTELPDPDKGLPLVFHPVVEGVDLISWATENLELLRAHLARHGGLLFRGFKMGSTEELQRFATSTSSGGLLDYKDASTPRSSVDGKVYTATDHPPELPIFLHSELSYSHTWPMKIYFLALRTATEGGATPIADTRRILAALDPEARETFRRRQILYVRNYGDGFGLPWQRVFGTTDRQEVEAFCRQAGISVEWKDENRLRTRATRPAIARHPGSGEEVWFNHAVLFHVSSLDPKLRRTALGDLADDELPHNTYFGDGAPIDPDLIEAVRRAYRQVTMSLPWSVGDVMLLDNMLAAHGREAFRGDRKVVVAMTEPHSLAGAVPAH